MLMAALSVPPVNLILKKLKEGTQELWSLGSLSNWRTWRSGELKKRVSNFGTRRHRRLSRPLSFVGQFRFRGFLVS